MTLIGAKLKKVTILVSSCGQCPKFEKYGLRSSHLCRIMKKKIENEGEIPDDCPLEDYIEH